MTANLFGAAAAACVGCMTLYAAPQIPWWPLRVALAASGLLSLASGLALASRVLS